MNMKIACWIFIWLFLSVSVFLSAKCPPADLTEDCRVDFDDLAFLASQWLTEGVQEPDGMVWVYIYDPGISGHESFSGLMSKYETTNGQYCQYLNAAIASGDITVNGNIVYGAKGSNPGADFVGQPYYNLAGEGRSGEGVYNGGAARILYSNGRFTVSSILERHPVTYVSWFGATAFCNYYGYRLPTHWEWSAVADYDGSYLYGCGTTINNDMANYAGSNHPYGTTVVGEFGTYGYGMCDMAGNVYEWTSSKCDFLGCNEGAVICKAGGWNSDGWDCWVLRYSSGYEYSWVYDYGFRACRDYDPIGIVWVSINDPGVSGHEGFKGQMSKYETTNAQYCQFLNLALSSGDIHVYENSVYGSYGSNGGTDYPQGIYYYLNYQGVNEDGATNGGAARITYNGGIFRVEAGFENHPVTCVSWYGATAFCNYFGWRLPTEWEWQAVADYDGSYPYGCGNTINNTMANYAGSVHPNGTTPVGSVGDPLGYGYGLCDMAGNVWEITSTTESMNTPVTRGGGWYHIAYFCTVYSKYSGGPTNSTGFRVCR